MAEDTPLKTEFQRTICKLIKADYSVVLVQTYEERRAIEAIRQVNHFLDPNRRFFSWAITTNWEEWTQVIDDNSGEVKVEHKAVTPAPFLGSIQAMDFILKDAEEGGKVYVMLDLHSALNPAGGGAITIRKLRDVYDELQGQYKTVILISPQMTIPDDLQKSVTVIDFPLPSAQEFADHLISRTIPGLQKQARTDEKLDALMPKFEKQIKEHLEDITRAALGLTMEEFINVIALCIANHDINPAFIIKEKEQIVKKGKILEFIKVDVNLDSVGGQKVTKEWIRRAKKRFTTDAKAFGLKPPKGILLIGPPGTGKSLLCKATAAELGMPLLRMDMGNIASEFYGKTTQNIKKANDLAKAVAPVVVQWDEVEKMLARGSGGGMSGAHEETARAYSTVLTDMEESQDPVLRAATCNDPESLPPELIQRFEYIAFVDLPTQEEREEIFEIHLKALKPARDPKKFNCKALAAASLAFAGREIRDIVMKSLDVAFDAGMKDVNTQIILDQINAYTPSAVREKEGINRIRQWAVKHGVITETQTEYFNNEVKTAEQRIQTRGVEAKVQKERTMGV